MSSVRIEFTVEPFVDGEPGAHVRAAWDAARETSGTLDEGPFSSQTQVSSERAAELVARVVDAALTAGATRVNVQVEAM
jgi:hypothetical protein